MGAAVFTLDVEDWFHILDLPSTPPLEQWSSLPSHVERNTRRMLDILREHEVKATLFFLGWVAERWPQLVKEAASDGHEIASHGYAHELVYTIPRERFEADIRKAKDIIEQAAGVRVLGYRCPGFSVTAGTPWFFDSVREAGHVYDSSIFPGQRGHGGLPGAKEAPHVIRTGHGDLVEFPISLGRMFGRPMYFFGGGYLRFFPYWLIRRKMNEVLGEGRPAIIYLHPREIDPHHPRLPMGIKRRFMTYVGLKTTGPKLHGLFRDFRFARFADLLSTVR